MFVHIFKNVLQKLEMNPPNSFVDESICKNWLT